MNESLRLTALFVRDLLGYNEQLIRIGRQNYDIDDFTIGYIGVDSLGAAQRLASGEKYDGNTERMSFQQQWQAPRHGGMVYGHTVCAPDTVTGIT
jgi:hypothetical protein